MIVEAIRNDIIEGRLTKGAKLPSRVELAERFGAGTVTIQAALAQLAKDGFVNSLDRSGTFVTERPPHLHRYGVLLPARPGDENWTHFWSVMMHVANELNEAGPDTFHIYLGLDSKRTDSDLPQLLCDVACRRLAGMISPFHLWYLSGSPVVKSPIPRAQISGDASAGNVCLHMDNEQLLERSVAWLKDQNCERIAVLHVPAYPQMDAARLVNLVRGHGMRTEPYWFQAMPFVPETISGVCRLLMAGPEADRPDGMLILDDNFLPAASAGLIAAGVRGVDDLAIISLCNFPLPSASDLPVQRIGYDIRAAFRMCMEGFELIRQGQAAPIRILPALFENEITSAPTRANSK